MHIKIGVNKEFRKKKMYFSHKCCGEKIHDTKENTRGDVCLVELFGFIRYMGLKQNNR